MRTPVAVTGHLSAGDRQTVKTSISLEPDLLRQARMMADLLGYRFSFSAFVADTLREKLECQTRRGKPQSV